MLPNIGPTELILVLLVVLLLFGGKKIPEIAKSIAQGIREFKRASNEPEKLAKPDDKRPQDEKEEEQK